MCWYAAHSGQGRSRGIRSLCGCPAGGLTCASRVLRRLPVLAGTPGSVAPAWPHGTRSARPATASRACASDPLRIRERAPDPSPARAHGLFAVKAASSALPAAVGHGGNDLSPRELHWSTYLVSGRPPCHRPAIRLASRIASRWDRDTRVRWPGFAGAPGDDRGVVSAAIESADAYATITGRREGTWARRGCAAHSAGRGTPVAVPGPGRGVSGRLLHGPGRGCRLARRPDGRRRGSAGTRWGGFLSADGSPDWRSIRARRSLPLPGQAFRPGRRGRPPRSPRRHRRARRPAGMAVGLPAGAVFASQGADASGAATVTNGMPSTSAPASHSRQVNSREAVATNATGTIGGPGRGRPGPLLVGSLVGSALLPQAGSSVACESVRVSAPPAAIRPTITASTV